MYPYGSGEKRRTKIQESPTNDDFITTENIRPPSGPRPPQDGGRPPSGPRPPQDGGRPPGGPRPPQDGGRPPGGPRPPQDGGRPPGGPRPPQDSGRPPGGPRPPQDGGRPPGGPRPPQDGGRPPGGPRPPQDGGRPPGRPGRPTQGPPDRIPTKAAPSVLRIDAGAIEGCMFNFTYVWLRNGQEFWFYPTFLGRTSIAGFRWSRGGWRYIGFGLNSIESFTCSRF